MSYTTKIKEEISSINNTESEIIAELAGFIRNNAIFIEDTITLTTENKTTIERVQNFLKTIYEINIDITTKDNNNFSKKELYALVVDQKVNKILQDIGLIDKDNNKLDTVPTYIVGANEEIRAYLRGVFLTCGSINDPKTSRYHMELFISTPEESIFVQKLLNLFDLNAKILGRDKGYMIYIKEAEKISDFIRILGANNAVLYYEDVRVYRDKKNQTNRLNNCEQANVDKMISTATSQVNDILFLKEKCAFELLDEKVREVAEYRLKYKEASLLELSEIISLETEHKITKSGVYHRIDKIKQLASKIREKEDKINKF